MNNVYEVMFTFSVTQCFVNDGFLKDDRILIKIWWKDKSYRDLNLVDYKVWGVLQERVYRTRIQDIDHLKQCLIEEWSHFDQRIIDRAVQSNSFKKKLKSHFYQQAFLAE